MKKIFLLIFIAVLCCIIYYTGSTKTDSPGIAMTGTHDSLHSDSVKSIISLCKHPIPVIILGLDGSEKRLVGLHPDFKIGMQSNLLNSYFPGIQKISGNVCAKAFAPNMEEIIKLKPDLILNWNRYPEAIAQMESFGYNVMGLTYDGSDQNDREMVGIVAKAIGRETMADSIIQLRDSSLKQIKMISNSIPYKDKPKVIFLYNYETLRVGGEKCYENFCIGLAGGRNMGAGLGIDRSVNIEQILEWDPDIILFGGWINNLDPEDIYQNPILANVSAVRNKRVLKMPHWASNESVLTWKWLAEIIQPDFFDYDIRENIRASYLWLYKIKLTEEDIDKVLFRAENEASPLYKDLKRTR